jgi:cytochrome c oxidase subunit 1
MEINPDHQDLQAIHPPPTSFWKRYLFSTDHKVIAKQFLWVGLFFLAFGGAEAMLIRWQWAHPGEAVPLVGNLLYPGSGGVITPADYNGLFTTHGMIMIFWAITPMVIGAFGNFCIPLMIGARDMAFPKLNMWSFWTFVLSSIVVLAQFVVPLGASTAGWTLYPPLSTNAGDPGWGTHLLVLAVFLAGVATLMGAINYITTVVRLRAPGMTWMRLPLTIWGLVLTSALNIMFVPVLAAAGILLLMDRMFGTYFFLAGSSVGTMGGDPVLFQHLFWIFGHPEVYILILPVWGIVADVLSVFARKPAAWYRETVLAFASVAALSGIVYGHHMYATGMSPVLGTAFEMLTLSISFPAVLLFLNWLHTIWQGSIRLTVPMLFALGVVFVFGLGGLTGLLLGTISTDLYLHDTLYVVGHFHLTMAASVLLGGFTAIYYWFPKMFGRSMSSLLGKVHFWITIVMVTSVFCLMLYQGYAGQSRRLWDPFEYQIFAHLRDISFMASVSAFILGAGQVLFALNFVYSVFRGPPAAQNPWEVGTLEWSVPTPIPVHNFDVVPTVLRGPHEFGDPAVKEHLGRDWISQIEQLVGPVASERGPMTQAGKG